MAVSKDKKRIPLALSKELVDRLDEEAKRAGTTRGAMLASWIADKINQLDIQRDMVEKLTSQESLNALAKAMIEAQFNTEKKPEINLEQLTLDLGKKVGD